MWGQNGKAKHSGSPGDQNFTFLGGGVDFKGVFTFDGTVRIDGRLEGEIHTKGTLVVGENAVIKGTITAGTLITSGKINGNITAIEKVQLQKPAILIGDVRTPVLSMEEGAHFHGMSNMGLQRWADAEAQATEKSSDPASPEPVESEPAFAQEART